MQDRLETILIDVYYTSMGGEWAMLKLTASEKREIEDYLITKVMKDPLGQSQVYYRLSSAGEVIVEYLLRKYSRATATKFGGIALEKRSWLIPHRHSFETKQVISALKYIAKRGEIPIKIYTDWSGGRRRVVFTDLDRGLSRISYEIEWELNKGRGLDYLKHIVGFGDVAAWLWVEVLDRNRKTIRSCSFQQEFIIWDK